jgi:single-strand DNA-binding protein
MFSKLIRIGKDTELRSTSGGKSVATINGVYDVGWGDNKKSQWIEAALWGKQAESLARFLVKGSQVVIYADDLCIETYDKKDGGQGFTLRCRVISVDLTDKQKDESQVPQERTVRGGIDRTVANNAPVQAEPRQSPQMQNTPTNGLDNNFDDDIPF